MTTRSLASAVRDLDSQLDVSLSQLFPEPTEEP